MNIIGQDVNILFCVEKPPKKSDGEEDVRWVNFLSNLTGHNTPWQGAIPEDLLLPPIRLAENIWLLPLKGSLPFLGRLVLASQFEGIKLPYRYIVLDEAPQWVASA